MRRKVRNSLVVIVVLVVVGILSVGVYHRKREAKMAPEEYWSIEELLRGEVEFCIPAPQWPTVKPEERYQMAKRFQSQGEWNKAVEAYRRAIEEYPDSEWAPYGQCTIGDLYRVLGDDIQAIEEYEKVVKNHPGTPWAPYAQFRIGDRYRNLKDFKQAMEAYWKIVRKYPKCHPVVRENAQIWVAVLKKGTR